MGQFQTGKRETGSIDFDIGDEGKIGRIIDVIQRNGLSNILKTVSKEGSGVYIDRLMRIGHGFKESFVPVQNMEKPAIAYLAAGLAAIVYDVFSGGVPSEACVGDYQRQMLNPDEFIEMKSAFAISLVAAIDERGILTVLDGSDERFHILVERTRTSFGGPEEADRKLMFTTLRLLPSEATGPFLDEFFRAIDFNALGDNLSPNDRPVFSMQRGIALVRSLMPRSVHFFQGRPLGIVRFYPEDMARSDYWNDDWEMVLRKYGALKVLEEVYKYSEVTILVGFVFREKSGYCFFKWDKGRILRKDFRGVLYLGTLLGMDRII